MIIITLWAAFLQRRQETTRGGLGGIHLTRDSRSVSLESDAFVWFDLNQIYVCTRMLLNHCQTLWWQCNSHSQTDPLAIFVCVRYVAQEGMSCTSRAAGRGISRLSRIIVQRDLHPVENHWFELCLDHLHSNPVIVIKYCLWNTVNPEQLLGAFSNICRQCQLPISLG